MDDPLFLVMQGIWLLAAGMYPLGFMFGVCSKCCDECPEVCGRCNHASAGDPNFGPCNIEVEYSYKINDGVEATGTRPAGNEDVAGAPFAVDSVTIPCAGDVDFVLNMQMYDMLTQASNDECNCSSCCTLSARFRLYTTLQQYQLDESSYVPVTFCDCTETSASTIVNWLDIKTLGVEEFEDLCPEAYADFIERIENSTVELRLDFDACECGACCTAGQCEEPVAELYCEDGGNWFLNKAAGVWQGVGTECDPNPCEE